MSFSRVVGQPRAIGVLRQALASDRVAHAYLFHGPAGTGKRAAALALALALVCERRGRAGAPADEACGACLACTKAARLIHPDVHVYLPFPKATGPLDRDPRPSDYGERLARLAADPYEASDYQTRAKLGDDAPATKAPAHRVTSVRGEPSDTVNHASLLHATSLAPAEASRTAVVIVGADLMNEVAANAFLKLLEEPPSKATLILTAERLDGLLPTILSRCQRVRFDALPALEVEQVLVARGVSDAQAAFVGRMSGGSLTRALDLLGQSELNDHRRLALDFVRAAYTGRPERIGPVVDAVAPLGRERVRAWLDLVRVWLRDMVLARELGEAAPLVNVDQMEAVHAFVAHVRQADPDAMTRLIGEAERVVEGNVSVPLTLHVLALGLGDAMRGRTAGHLVLPLAHA